MKYLILTRCREQGTVKEGQSFLIIQKNRKEYKKWLRSIT